jgi:hypothetical protein
MRKEPDNTANDVLSVRGKRLRIEQLNRTAAVKICGLSLWQTDKLTGVISLPSDRREGQGS